METEKREHIFIVEDNQIYSMMLDYFLTKDSIYKFSSFKSGEECIKNLFQNPDVIILDYALPGMNGYEVLLEIKKYNPDIHVLILTSNKDEALAKKLLDAGADDYILKQGHGEKQIIEKIENLLTKDEIKESRREKSNRRSFFKKLLYAGLTAVLIVLSVIYYKLQ